jgi:hypothetical protein
MAEQRRYRAVVLSNCRAVQGDRCDDQSGAAGRRNGTQATERNVLLGRAELEVCPSAQPTAAALAAPDVTEDMA